MGRSKDKNRATRFLNKRSGTQFYDWKPMWSIFDILHKNFQDDQLNSRRFPGFPGGFLNSSRFPDFPGVVDTLTVLCGFGISKGIHPVKISLQQPLKLFSAVLCTTTVHRYMHTRMSSSYNRCTMTGWFRFSLGYFGWFACFFLPRSGLFSAVGVFSLILSTSASDCL